MVMNAERHLKCLPQLELKNNKVAYLPALDQIVKKTQQIQREK